MFVKEFIFSTWVTPKPFPIISSCITSSFSSVTKSSYCLRKATRLNPNILMVYCPGNDVISQDLKNYLAELKVKKPGLYYFFLVSWAQLWSLGTVPTPLHFKYGNNEKQT